jgi:hypothetical protein
MLEIAKREREEEENIRGRKPIKKFSVGLDSTEARESSASTWALSSTK